MAEESGPSSIPLHSSDTQSLQSSSSSLSLSPKAEVDNASLKNCMDKNKESLKLKLMLRRPINQLVEQGIIPPPKQSPGLYEQSKKLERARMEDFLKHKIQKRPDRQVLIQQHILEDTKISPSLQEKQRQLKRARLADDLNDRLSHRPGPLELVKGNILLTDEKFAQAVKEGQIQFKATSEGEPIKHPPPRFVIEEKDETSSDDAASPPQSRSSDRSCGSDKDFFPNSDVVQPSFTTTINSSNSNNTVITNGHQQPFSQSSIQLTPVTNMITSSEAQPFTFETFSSIPFSSSATSIVTAPFSSPINATSQISQNSIKNQQQFNVNTSTLFSSSSTSSSPSLSSGVTSSKDSVPVLTKNRKKSKSKSQLKTKTIKFHEYKGPPNAQKNQSSQSNSSETSYELLLKQQQLFLQWQLEWQQKYPQIILPAAQKNNLDQGQGSNGQITNSGQINSIGSLILTAPNRNQANNVENSANIGQTNIQSNGIPSSNPSSKLFLKLEDMKVSDLKSELKKRNLPVSGSKPQLIERLKPFLDSLSYSKSENNNSQMIITNGLVVKNENQNITKMEEVTPMSPINGTSSTVENDNSTEKSGQKGSPSGVTPMEIDGNANFIGIGNVTVDSNEDVQKIQPTRIDDIHREVQKRQLQLHFQNPPVFTNQAQSVTIPLTALTTPQIQILSTSPAQVTDVNCSESKSLQRQILQQNLQQKIQQQSQPPNLAAIISPGNASAAVKANLAAFLHNQAAQHQNQQSNTSAQFSTQPIATHSTIESQALQTNQTRAQPSTFSLPFLTTQVIDSKNFPTFQQVLLYPSSINTQSAASAAPNEIYVKQQRTNSLPNNLQEKSHLVSQRTSSLPNFSTLVNIKNDSSVNERIDNTSSSLKPPPAYEEATKDRGKEINNKKFNESQAFDDVIEILMKNGELPLSCGNESFQMFSNEDKTSNQNLNSSLFGSTEMDSEMNKIEEKKLDNNLDCYFNNHMQEMSETINTPILDDQDHLNNNHSLFNNKSEKLNFRKEELKVNNFDSTANDLLLSELMDFQESPINLDYSNWLVEIMSNENVNHLKCPSSLPQRLENPFNNVKNNFSINLSAKSDCNSFINSSISSASSSSSSSSSSSCTSTDHDPILPNNMVDTSQGDPLIDLYFDESDCRENNDLVNLVWDRIDFAT